MLIAEPVQNAGGCLVPPPGYWQGLRQICDRHGILLCSDEVICAFGRIGEWFGAQRLGYEPDLITFAKGLTGAHFAMGGLMVSDKVAAPFLDGRSSYLHGVTFGGHPVGSAVALKAIEIFEREEVLANVRSNETKAQEVLEGLLDIPIVGDARGMGHFWALEIVQGLRDQGAAARRALRVAAQGRPLREALRAGPDLPPRRPGRPDRPDCPAARRRPRGLRRDRRDPAGRARARGGAGERADVRLAGHAELERSVPPISKRGW